MERVYIHSLIQPIQNCVELQGKPKIVIVQACRLDNNNDQSSWISNTPNRVSQASTKRIPKDTIIIYASVPGTPAIRPSVGPSRLIELLSDNLGKYGKWYDFQTITELVCKEMTEDEEIEARGEKYSLCPSVELTLAKKIVFFPECILNTPKAPIGVASIVIDIGHSTDKKLEEYLKQTAKHYLSEGWPVTISISTLWPSDTRRPITRSGEFGSVNDYSEKIQFADGQISIGMSNLPYSRLQEKALFLNVKPYHTVTGLRCQWRETIRQEGKCVHNYQYTRDFYFNSKGHRSVIGNGERSVINENDEVDITVEISSVKPIPISFN